MHWFAILGILDVGILVGLALGAWIGSTFAPPTPNDDWEALDLAEQLFEAAEHARQEMHRVAGQYGQQERRSGPPA